MPDDDDGVDVELAVAASVEAVANYGAR